MSRLDRPPPMPEVSLGVMKSCAHLGALARQVAIDREQDVALDAARYRRYEQYLTSRRTLFGSPDYAVLLAYASDELRPETIRNLGVQTCVAAYYGFGEPMHHEAMQRKALACQHTSSGAAEFEPALDDCMGRGYRRLLARWWRHANEAGALPAELLATSARR